MTTWEEEVSEDLVRIQIKLVALIKGVTNLQLRLSAIEKALENESRG